MSCRGAFALAIAATLCAASAAASDGLIDVVVPAKKPSRPAHFHWEFVSANGRPARIGQFACGSYWVAPAPGDTGVKFVSLTGNPEWNDDLLSCDADPVTERHGLLSGEKRYGSYCAEENVLPRLPANFTPKPGSCISLVAAMQRNEKATSKGGTRAIVGEVVDAYCVVTVMPDVPPDGGIDTIRPNITGVRKEMLTWDDFALDRLPTHAFLEGRSPESWESTARRWRHCCEVFSIATEMDTKRGKRFVKFSEGGRAFRSHLLIHNYAAGMAVAFNGDLLAMFAEGEWTVERRRALAAMISFGLDIYHARYEGGTARRCWTSGAGQSLGAFLPPVFAAALLRDETKAHRLRMAAVTNHGPDRAERGPQELRQIKRGRTGVLLWGDGQPIIREGNKMVEVDWRYWGELAGSRAYDAYAGDRKPNTALGKKTSADPYGYVDGPGNKPGANYMGMSVGCFRSFAAAMILMPEIRSVVNSDAPIEYADRVTRHGLWAWPDPVAPPAEVDQETAHLWWKAKGVREWQKTWGPRPDDVRFAIEGKTGRFKSVHGHKARKWGYETAQARNTWNRIIALYDGERFEDNAVDLGVVVKPEIFFAKTDRTRAYLDCATPDATIRYTLDGTEPTNASRVYRGTPLPVDAGTTVRAYATARDMKPSAVRARTAPRW